MKVLLFNGSPHKEGNTAIALAEVARTLEAAGIETETIQVGSEEVRGCTGCGKCAENDHRCVFDDVVNEALDKVEKADGFVFGSPVYYASPNGTMVSFMDRLFYAGARYFAHKPAACIAVARRGGTTATYDMLNKYLGISNAIIVASNYWNSVHGRTPGEASQDLEGMQTMRILGTNMAWVLKLVECGKANGLPAPALEGKVMYNFVR